MNTTKMNMSSQKQQKNRKEGNSERGSGKRYKIQTHVHDFWVATIPSTFLFLEQV